MYAHEQVVSVEIGAGNAVILNLANGQSLALTKLKNSFEAPTEEETTMAFSTAISGINAAQSDLNVISNNIANSSTVGFKVSRAQFAEISPTPC